mgnify:CR=1 FL=1
MYTITVANNLNDILLKLMTDCTQWQIGNIQLGDSRNINLNSISESKSVSY